MTGSSILGTRVLRKEDPKFLTTGGKYVDDLFEEERLTGAVHVTYARSSAAHARIISIDTSEAEAMPGVIAVFTAESLALQPVPAAFNPMVARTLLASDKVRYVGEPVVAIVTETREQGEDAAEGMGRGGRRRQPLRPDERPYPHRRVSDVIEEIVSEPSPAPVRNLRGFRHPAPGVAPVGLPR